MQVTKDPSPDIALVVVITGFPGFKTIFDYKREGFEWKFVEYDGNISFGGWEKFLFFTLYKAVLVIFNQNRSTPGLRYGCLNVKIC